jgi:integrase
LTKVRVKDFDRNGKTLFVQFGKSKGEAESRHVFLLPEAVAWFQKLVQGRESEDLMFKRPNAERTTREELKGFDGWASYDQVHAMEKAVRAAGIARVTFHELRHYADSRNMPTLLAGCA